MNRAYSEAIDPISLREEQGKVETGRRALGLIERHVRTGTMVDLGCWTGSFLVAARERGWKTVGVEPSTWAAERARQKGLDVRIEDLFTHRAPPAGYSLVTLCDVLEHLVDPCAAVDVIREFIQPHGVFYLTVPDFGSLVARAIGRRWWSVLPMHLQYFTRSSIRLLLESHGFSIRDIRSHAKVFSVRYYAERLGGYSEGLAGLSVDVLDRLGLADRMVAPNFHDRMSVIAVRS